MARGMDFGTRLRALRIAAGLTQEALARRARATQKFVSEIENGHANPSIRVAMRLVENGLELPMSAFFAADVVDVRDDLGRLRALLGGQPASVRQRALRVIKALVED